MLRRRSPKNMVAEVNIERFRRAQRGIFKVKKRKKYYSLLTSVTLTAFWGLLRLN